MHNNHPSVPRFENVSLQDSYVLDIAVHPGLLTLKLDLLLLPRHPRYRTPLPGERACFRPVTVVFSSVRALHWTGQSVVKAAVDASGSADYGSIDALTALDEDSYKILGDWGEIIVQSEAPSMSIDPTHID
ncbi:hypothetical protein ACJ7VE_39105 [Streptomyces sp. PB17]|uniref:hypothetical protein n=1 Tax=Streptomyces sp. PB17 TaxID=3384158 RepID=UPI0038B55038